MEIWGKLWFKKRSSKDRVDHRLDSEKSRTVRAVYKNCIMHFIYFHLTFQCSFAKAFHFPLLFIPYITMWWGYNEFVLLFVTSKNTGPRPTFYYTDRLRITFWIDLTMSVRPSVCVSMYSCSQSTGRKWQYIWMKFGMVASFGHWTNPIVFGNNRTNPIV